MIITVDDRDVAQDRESQIHQSTELASTAPCLPEVMQRMATAGEERHAIQLLVGHCDFSSRVHVDGHWAHELPCPVTSSADLTTRSNADGCIVLYLHIKATQSAFKCAVRILFDIYELDFAGL
ncbi:hypothetical protein Poli38472_005166 [Pythium oligandrum]|uniref:Uncharacterized protein n=1 Tax=Pythium oligandrum TaxID=41045 RepID=A0A8K1FLC8_PYTOL|nr:hypothetical protein Poli38472_005166 [Pythium oligandrum]|eukprot:TMW62548.1 hypothetical protein Poli38472_005166 [Pythium oligandrum]